MSKLSDSLLKKIRAAELPEPVAEFEFHPTRGWRFDFAYPGYRVAVEVEGGVWVAGKSRHNRGAGMVADMEKYNEASLLGWVLIRCDPSMIRRGVAVDFIKRALQAARERGREAGPTQLKIEGL